MLFVGLITYRLVKVYLQGCGSCGRGAVEGRAGTLCSVFCYVAQFWLVI